MREQISPKSSPSWRFFSAELAVFFFLREGRDGDD